MLSFLPPLLHAGQEGDFIYSIKDNAVTITKYTGKGGAVAIPEKVANLPVTRIGDEVFRNCTGLTSITIPASVTTISYGAFGGCTGLTSLTIPDGVTIIGTGAFFNCTGLTSLTIPASVTSINNELFINCTGLTSITIPASVTNISYSAFEGCTGLTSVTFEGNAPSKMEGKVFYKVAADFTIRYYKGATGFTTPEWNGYKTVEIDPATELFDWTSKDSKTIKANFVKLDGEAVVVRTEDDKEHKIPFTRLSPASVAQAKMFGGGSK